MTIGSWTVVDLIGSNSVDFSSTSSSVKFNIGFQSILDPNTPALTGYSFGFWAKSNSVLPPNLFAAAYNTRK